MFLDTVFTQSSVPLAASAISSSSGTPLKYKTLLHLWRRRKEPINFQKWLSRLSLTFLYCCNVFRHYHSDLDLPDQNLSKVASELAIDVLFRACQLQKNKPRRMNSGTENTTTANPIYLWQFGTLTWRFMYESTDIRYPVQSSVKKYEMGKTTFKTKKITA